MIIDMILDRKEGEPYNAREFYLYCNSDEVGWDIARAMDGGTNEDVIAEICRYLVNNEYLPEDISTWNKYAWELAKFVESVDWLN